MSSSSTHLPTPEGPGSVSGAPNLPSGFTDTFTSRYIDTAEVRLHAVIGGEGPPLLLVHGWPQTWYQWRLVMPELARDFEVVAVDQRGIGLSDKPQDGYDTGTLAGDLVALMDALGHQRFALVGFDTGMPISYALAADHPDRVDRLVVGEGALPKVASLAEPSDTRRSKGLPESAKRANARGFAMSFMSIAKPLGVKTQAKCLGGLSRLSDWSRPETRSFYKFISNQTRANSTPLLRQSQITECSIRMVPSVAGKRPSACASGVHSGRCFRNSRVANSHLWTKSSTAACTSSG